MPSCPARVVSSGAPIRRTNASPLAMLYPLSARPPSTSTSTHALCWRNVPVAIWTYKLGGYQVLKKWLSYRERSILERPLLPEEVQHFTDTARRIGAILTAAGSSRP